jgi:hypothetical protein
MRCLDDKCREEIPDHSRVCVVCGKDAGYPNVRATEKREEVEAVEKRYQNAILDSKKRECDDIVEQFRIAITSSEAVFCRPIGKMSALVSSDNELYASFHSLVEAGMRLPEKNTFDISRSAIDATLFPNYFKDIQFAALSLDGLGPRYYGECSIVLRDVSVASRATVFEENSIDFFDKHKVPAGKQPPVGYKAPWMNRDRLAVSKLASGINKGTEPKEFPGILLRDDAKQPDFIEVHIYGLLHRRAIKEVFVTEPKRKADKTILQSAEKKLREVGASLTVVKSK